MSNKCDIFEADKGHEIYLFVKNEIKPPAKKAKKFVQQLWEKAYPYLDNDFIDRFPKEYPQRVWEMYLVVSLLEVGLKLETRNDPQGPDICIKADNRQKIWIEAVTASPGKEGNPNTVQEPKAWEVTDVGDEQIKLQLRLLNSFDDKYKGYKTYKENGIVEDKDLYIIAINGSQIPWSWCDKQMIPRIVKSLLPIGIQVFDWNDDGHYNREPRYIYQRAIAKKNAKLISTNRFLNKDYSGISAVIYSVANDIPEHPERISEELLLFHNPLASNPLPLCFLKTGREYWVCEQQKTVYLKQIDYYDFPKNEKLICHTEPLFNYWHIMADVISWSELEKEYAQNFSEEKGTPVKPFRMALGALIIKEKLRITDIETVEQIKSNFYLQYFIGLLDPYSNEAPFEASMLDHFRQIIPADLVNQISEKMVMNQLKIGVG